jgi:pumilio RNA-binding family
MDVASLQQRSELLHEIIQNSLQLVQDPFGNYVVQYVLRMGVPQANEAVAMQLRGHVFHLSTQKFSSNVVEQCLMHGTAEMQRVLVEELCSIETIRGLIGDQFGNYVIQRALAVAKEPEFSRFVELIRPCMAWLKETSAGCRIGQKLMKKYPQLADDSRSMRNNRKKGKPKG